MRKLLIALAAAALVGGAVAPANAAVVPFTGTMTIQIGTLPGIPALGGGSATINQSAGGHPITHLSLPAGALQTSITAPVPNAFPIIQIVLNAQNGPVVLSGGGCTTPHPNVTCPGVGLNGFGGVSGVALVGIFTFTTHLATSAISSPTSMGLPLPAANLVVPLGVVGGGSTVMTVGLGIKVTVSGAGWTTGTAGVYNPTAPIFTHVPAAAHVFPTINFTTSQSITIGYGSTVTNMGSKNTNTASDFNTDTITLVSPVQIFNTATGAFIPSLASIAIHLVPEPGTLLLLGSGIVGLALYGRRRMRK